MPTEPGLKKSLTRRKFLHTSIAAAATSFVAGCASTQRRREAPAILAPLDGERLRIGLIGCGGRGTGAAQDALKGSPNMELVAVGDVFPERIERCRTALHEFAGKEGLSDCLKVTPERCFTGFDAYKGVLATPVDLVILATPPHFRPLHLRAAIEAGKHVFMEKPVAVDPVGVRSVIESADMASRKSLAIVAGTQRRHQPHYVETMRRIHDGQIGEIVGAQCYWNMGGLWVKKREPAWSDMEWQLRNWLYFTWLSGDHIVEQHVHNLDVVNWALEATPEKCMGMGGRQVRVEPEYGNIFDHFSVEYEFAGGVRSISMCRQTPHAAERVAERIVGSRGSAYLNDSTARISGSRPWSWDDGGKAVNPYVQEHTDLVASIRSGRPLNEGRRIAESTLTAIMGRMSAYTGRELQWSWAMNASQLDLTPPHYEMGTLAVEPVAMPGVTKLV